MMYWTHTVNGKTYSSLDLDEMHKPTTRKEYAAILRKVYGNLYGVKIWEHKKVTYFESRHAALKAFPNAIIRKLLKGAHVGEYTAFNDYTTYEQWRDSGLVR